MPFGSIGTSQGQQAGFKRAVKLNFSRWFLSLFAFQGGTYAIFYKTLLEMVQTSFTDPKSLYCILGAPRRTGGTGINQ